MLKRLLAMEQSPSDHRIALKPGQCKVVPVVHVEIPAVLHGYKGVGEFFGCGVRAATRLCKEVFPEAVRMVGGDAYVDAARAMQLMFAQGHEMQPEAVPAGHAADAEDTRGAAAVRDRTA